MDCCRWPEVAADRNRRNNRSLRRTLAGDMGFVLPSIRIQDTLTFAPHQYQIFVKDIVAGKGELRPLMMLAINTNGEAPDLVGEPTTDPTFGLPAARSSWPWPRRRWQRIARSSIRPAC